MNTGNIILLFLAAALFVVGAHLTITQGIMVSYPVLMFAVAILFWYQYKNNKARGDGNEGSKVTKTKSKSKR